MKASLRIFFAGLLLGGLGATWWFTREDAEPLPNERKVAMELLLETQAGPGYFQRGDPAPDPDENGVVWIDALAAREQIDRIVAARNGDEALKKRIGKLVDEGSEPHPSRMVGGERVNLARLNLALDDTR